MNFKAKYETNYNALISSRLNEAMKRAGISRKQLAELTGADYNRIGTYLRGDVVPTANILAEMAKVLDVSSDYLIGLSDIPTNCSEPEAANEYTNLSETALESTQGGKIMPDTYTEPSVFVSKSEYTKLMEAKAKLDVLAKCVKKFEYASDFLKICEVVLGVEENDNF